jgi:putative ABC transport system ATP-binding protein
MQLSRRNRPVQPGCAWRLASHVSSLEQARVLWRHQRPGLSGRRAGSGEFVGIIGKSGSGKSTLINMLAGIDRPTSGEVDVAGTRVDQLDESRMAQWRGHNLGIVFQFFQLLPMLSLLENVMLPMDFCHTYPAGERRTRALRLLDMVGMADQAGKLPSALSGGQQQRVAIARALANDPPIVVADEPTGNLDSKTAESVFSMFEALVKQGKTIVMVTHDSALARRVKRTVLIADGEIVNEWLAHALPLLTHQLIWLIIVVVLSILASTLPDLNASRLTVREVLAHE